MSTLRYLLLYSMICFTCTALVHAEADKDVFAQDSINIGSQLNDLVKELPAFSDVNIAIYDLSKHRALYEHRAIKRARPASIQKLATAITALTYEAKQPGQIHFETSVWTDGEIRNDTLHGDLYLKGGMDPLLQASYLDSLVNHLDSCFHVVTGRLYGDISLTDSLHWRSGWIWDDNPGTYQPYLSPLVYQRDQVTIVAQPDTVLGQPAQIHIVGDSLLPIHLLNQTQTVARRQKDQQPFRLTRHWLRNSNLLIARGDVSFARERSVNLYNSQDYAMWSFKERLYNKGIRILKNGTPRDTPYYLLSQLPEVTYKTLPNTVPTQKLASVNTPLITVLKEMLKESDNLYAESVLTQIGRAVRDKRHAEKIGNDSISHVQSVRAIDGILGIAGLMDSLKIAEDQYELYDGSGLSIYNRITPSAMCKLLEYAYEDSKIFHPLYKSLPISGIDGTLKYRMANKRSAAFKHVVAKTGTVTGSSCLAGYLTTEKGKTLAFVIMNENMLKARDARKWQDKVCELLVTFPYLCR